MSFLPLVLIVLVFYLFFIRPQMKKSKDQKKFRAAIKKGDKVITSSGIWGTVTNMDKETETVTLQIADNTKIRLQRDHISSIRPSSGEGGQ